MQSYQREATFASKMTVLPDVLAFVEETCTAAGVNPALFFDLQLATEEACSNVIEHAYRSHQGATFRLAFTVNNTDVIITLHDRGRPFDPQAVARPDPNLPLDKRPIGGLGLYLIYQLMDDVRFRFDAAGNTLTLVKRNAIGAPAVAGNETTDDA